ncbi:MAG: transcription termination/antitermination protein NusA [Armatimonadetes bacterium]|nr:transcription termination/antitermination protein NusA [Armatimonadota bacterium]MBS1711628.1 transcription termination/antitermination protein NusA [Armatimonadota bacterium]MBX3109817.1 transcription termination/antitermination protein NusA [Fimbriimonadaceae bacterium]
MDILQQLQQIANERDLSTEELRTELETALAVAYKKYKAVQGEVVLRLDNSVPSGAVIEKEVVGEVLEPSLQVSIQVAQKYKADAQIGDFLPLEVDPNTFGRIAAQTFKQVLQQKIREAELRKLHDQFSDRVGEVMSGIVMRREEGNVLLQVDRKEVVLPKREQVGTDDYRPQERMRVLVLKIEEDRRGFQVIASRSHPNLLRKLLEQEVPEIAEGVVEIMSIAREPGQRSKIAVISHDERIDAVGACVGQRGSRIQVLMDELRPEKIDVVPWSSEPKTFIVNALSPAKVNSIRMNEEEKSAYVVVPDNQLSLAIGRGGQNVRLAARLTEWKIDIRSEEQANQEKAAARTQGSGDPSPSP